MLPSAAALLRFLLLASTRSGRLVTNLFRMQVLREGSASFTRFDAINCKRLHAANHEQEQQAQLRIFSMEWSKAFLVLTTSRSSSW